MTATGDLLDQPVEALVNPWNRNFVPRGLLLTTEISASSRRAFGPILPVGVALRA